MDDELEQQTNGDSMVPPPIPSAELALTDLADGEGEEWPDAEPLMDAELEQPGDMEYSADLEQPDLSPNDSEGEPELHQQDLQQLPDANDYDDDDDGDDDEDDDGNGDDEGDQNDEDYQNEGYQNENYQNEDYQNDDYQNDDYQNDDYQNEVYQNEDDQNVDEQNEDDENREDQNEDDQNEDDQNEDDQNEDDQNGDDQNEEHQNVEGSEKREEETARASYQLEVLPKALQDALNTICPYELMDPERWEESMDDENAVPGPASTNLADEGEGADSSMQGQHQEQGQGRVEGKQDKNRRKKKRKKENRKARRELMQRAHEQRQQQKQPVQPSAGDSGKAAPGPAVVEEYRQTTDSSVHHSAGSADEGEDSGVEKNAKSVPNGRSQKTDDDQDEQADTLEHESPETDAQKAAEELERDEMATEVAEHSQDKEEQEHEEEEEEEEPAEKEKNADSDGDNGVRRKVTAAAAAAAALVAAKSKLHKQTLPLKGKAKGSKEGLVATTEQEEDPLDGVEIEYVPEKVSFVELDPMYRQFYQVFEIFKLDTRSKESGRAGGEEAERERAAAEAQKKAQERRDAGGMDDDDDDDDDDMGDERDERDDKEKISKRKLKKLTRLSVAELKQLVTRPDVVEMHDVTARDPKLLVQLKSHRNTVQVPRHWCFKRKYLQGKRGIEKPPFDLPAFIKKTGIMEMRASLQEKDEAKTLKAKMRERARPKMGKIDIDYQKLHDAFFKWQTKPRMTIHGDLYYEGKEFETRLKEKKPGDLSEELRIALGMPIGPACHKIPPPWLIAQQRYGPPPSYPNLKIPGLNAPIPDGCSFGYHAGGWGKPPVDESGKPLYGDVFGMAGLDGEGGMGEEEIDRTVWGELESESEESSEEEEDEGEDLGGAGAMPPDESGLITPAEGLVTPSGLTSGVPAGMETPDTIELRKKKIESEMEDNETPVLYHVLPEKRNERIGGSMMASTHVYDIAAAGGGAGAAAAAAAAAAAGGGRAGRAGGGQPIDREGMVELALDPSELDLDNEAMAQRYEQQLREQQSHLQKEDLSDMLAEHVARQKSKRKRQQTDTTSKQSKKYKEFKF